jgi:PRTRC genetic system protein C
LQRLSPLGEWFLSMPERVPAIFEKERSMAIEVSEIQRSYRYNGIHLPDVPGLDAREIRDLYSAQYPELVSAEIETGEICNGVQEITFKRAVGTKG